MLSSGFLSTTMKNYPWNLITFIGETLNIAEIRLWNASREKLRVAGLYQADGNMKPLVGYFFSGKKWLIHHMFEAPGRMREMDGTFFHVKAITKIYSNEIVQKASNR